MPLLAPPALTSQLLSKAGFSHGFFMRGDVSAELSFGGAANRSVVQASMVVAAAWVHLPPSELYEVQQVHGCEVRVVRDQESRQVVQCSEADALLTCRPATALAIKTADCVPILIGDRRSGAVAAVHSGWKGTALGIVRASLRALGQHAGGHPDWVIAIGPHIEACCFEVGEEVAAELERALGERGVSVGELGVLRRAGERPHVDLRSLLDAELRAIGILPTSIDQVRGCTACNPSRFHSHRRDGANSGRLLSLIASRGSDVP